MTRLEVDVGNTFLKWRIFRNGYYLPAARGLLSDLELAAGGLQFDRVLGRDTKSCIEHGVYLGQAGFVKEVLAEVSADVVICTGGGYLQLKEVLNGYHALYVEDLVLDGLRIVADSIPGQ